MLEENLTVSNTDCNDKKTEKRKKRVKRMKVTIIVIVIILFLLPTLFCIFLGVRVCKLQKQLDELVSIHQNETMLTKDEKNSNTNTMNSSILPFFNVKLNMNEAIKSLRLKKYNDIVKHPITLTPAESLINSERFMKQWNRELDITNIIDVTDQIPTVTQSKEADRVTSGDHTIGKLADQIDERDQKMQSVNMLKQFVGEQQVSSEDNVNQKMLQEEPDIENISDEMTKQEKPTEEDQKSKGEDNKSNNQKSNDQDNKADEGKTAFNKNESDIKIKSASVGKYAGQKVYLTFDDGPSKYTDEILDILAEYDIKATFFVVGKTDKVSKRLYQRIVDEGHTLGMHSYSHVYQKIYNSLQDFEKDFTKLWKLLYDTTGYMPTIYRFPGGSSNLVNKNGMDEFIRYLNQNSVLYYDWNVENGDATKKEYTKEQLVDNVLNGIDKRKTSIVLMHDVQTKKTTVDSLPMLLEELISQGAELLPLDESVPPIQQIKAEQIK